MNRSAGPGRRLLAILALGAAAIAVPPFALRPGPDRSLRVLRFANRDEGVRLPAGLAMEGDAYAVQEGDVLFVTHLSNQWDHSAAAAEGAARVLDSFRALAVPRIVHLRGLTPEWQRSGLVGAPAGTRREDRYFADPPPVESFAERFAPWLREVEDRRERWVAGKRYPDPFLLDSSVPLSWAGPFERGAFSQGGGFYERESDSVLSLDPRYERILDRAVDVPAGVTRFVVVGGWFHACLTRTVKDLVLDAYLENEATRLDVVLPAGAVFVNDSGADEDRTISLAARLEALDGPGREAFFALRLESIHRHVSRMTGRDVPVEFVHRRSSFRRPGCPSRVPVHVWVVDRVE